MNYLCIGGPKHQHQVYGPLSAYLQGYKYPATHFLVKPQALLREECSDTVEALHDEEGEWSYSFPITCLSQELFGIRAPGKEEGQEEERQCTIYIADVFRV